MRVLCLLVIAALAGCTDEAPAGEDVLAVRIDLHGVVVDPALTPVAGVHVDAGPLGNQTTGDDGAFRFADVGNGTFRIRATATGYLDAEVLVDSGTDARIMLERLEEDTPFTVVTQFNGYIGCSVQAGPFVQDGICDAVDPDRREVMDLGTVQVPDAVQTEVVWESTQTAGDNLGMIQCMVDRGLCQGGDGRMGNIWGPSPLVCRVTAEAGCGNPDGTGGGVGLGTTGSSGRIEVSVYASCAAQCVPGTSFGAGVAAQQGYQVLTAAFFGWVPAEEWRFTDGAA